MDTNTILFRHSIDINHIVIDYILQFKRGTQNSSNFLEKIKGEFQERIKKADDFTFDKSAHKEDNILLADDSYLLKASIKNIDELAFPNLKAALKRIIK